MKIGFWAKRVPSLSFYLKFAAIVLRAGGQAKRGQYGDAAWVQSQWDILRALEKVGVAFDVSGVGAIQRVQRPCVFIANHMSTLETVILGLFIQPNMPVTFVVKHNLLTYPVFKHSLRTRNPIAVSRQNPRDDLKAVLEGGVERLQNGTSIIVFPQTKRTATFDPARFNSIGVKLARKAGAPIIPVALATDAWGIGKYLKDLGKIDPSKNVFIAFGEPLEVQGRGEHAHAATIAFIQARLREWRPAAAEPALK
jgi:1-acyl-sn-glycerol-3-phosphate acyltransferase